VRAVTVNLETHRLEVKGVRSPNARVTTRCSSASTRLVREIARSRRSGSCFPSAGDSFLTIGHEALGQVVESGRNVG